MSFIGMILIVFAMGLVNYIICMAALKSFLSSKASLKDAQDMEDFKRMVRKQMHQALLQISIILAMGALAVVGITIGKMSFLAFIAFIALNIVNVVLGKLGKRLEERARSLPIDDAGLKDEYDAVCKAWVEKPFPNF